MSGRWRKWLEEADSAPGLGRGGNIESKQHTPAGGTHILVVWRRVLSSTIGNLVPRLPPWTDEDEDDDNNSIRASPASGDTSVTWQASSRRRQASRRRCSPSNPSRHNHRGSPASGSREHPQLRHFFGITLLLVLHASAVWSTTKPHENLHVVLQRCWGEVACCQQTGHPRVRKGKPEEEHSAPFAAHLASTLKLSTLRVYVDHIPPDIATSYSRLMFMTQARL
ncbi:uncharacterized protein B0I36DRAFT_344743 [Microdochium trichocladiopsis]|uniref:Uncharacterized protein n=1 Tax=Microdochium trichocladiopsis TaxID=1682393 RepID=A0A9P9BW88_9PEZI|nr:uncharacterized protein B0I36DRAFT_344743 [Microdochium trichocladiopsis]KAH7041113.1 hypothetical protein B0I36DRAFT_344743 [Microdochium trichocladiopsis]